MRIHVTSSAEADMVLGVEFYEEQHPGLGEFFLINLSRDIDKLEETAGIHARCGEYFRSISKRFPYAIFYTVEEDLVTVWAILDTRQDPVRIEERLN